MNKNIYANSDEKFVKATVLFSSEDKIYYDEACTEEVTLEDALNLFKKGLMLVSVDGGFKRPTGITVTEEGYEISYGGNGGGSGQEEFVVTLDIGDNDTYTSNRSRSEIEEAYTTGKKIVGKMQADGETILLFIGVGNDAALFFTLLGGLVLFAIDDEKNVTAFTNHFLPEVSDEDNGKVLTVDNGAWEAVLPSE